MGKYDNFFIKYSGKDIEIAMANELAEANRLKRLELKLQHDGMATDDFLKQMEDQV